MPQKFQVSFELKRLVREAQAKAAALIQAERQVRRDSAEIIQLGIGLYLRGQQDPRAIERIFQRARIREPNAHALGPCYRTAKLIFQGAPAPSISRYAAAMSAGLEWIRNGDCKLEEVSALIQREGITNTAADYKLRKGKWNPQQYLKALSKLRKIGFVSVSDYDFASDVIAIIRPEGGKRQVMLLSDNPDEVRRVARRLSPRRNTRRKSAA